MIKIFLLALVALVSSKHAQHDYIVDSDEQWKQKMSDKVDALTELVLKQAEIIKALEKKEAHRRQDEASEKHVKQNPITYIAAVAAGYPISTSTDWNSGHQGLNGVINKALPRIVEDANKPA